jgi:hypothetical protein
MSVRKDPDSDQPRGDREVGFIAIWLSNGILLSRVRVISGSLNNSCPGTKVEAFEEWNALVRGERLCLSEGETSGISTRNPDARPLNNHRGEASMNRDGPERKENILSGKREGSNERLVGAPSALGWNVD